MATTRMAMIETDIDVYLPAASGAFVSIASLSRSLARGGDSGPGRSAWRTQLPHSRRGLLFSNHALVANALDQIDGAGRRPSFAKIASADLIQTNSLGPALCSVK